MALKDITLGQYFPGHSLVHRLDPRTKILAVVIYIVALFLAKSFVTYAIMFTLLALSVGSLLGGTAIIESIFQWDGVGKLAVDAITMRDYPMIQAYVVWMAVIYVAVNLVTDLLYHALDPRIRLGVSRE